MKQYYTHGEVKFLLKTFIIENDDGKIYTELKPMNKEKDEPYTIESLHKAIHGHIKQQGKHERNYMQRTSREFNLYDPKTQKKEIEHERHMGELQLRASGLHSSVARAMHNKQRFLGQQQGKWLDKPRVKAGTVSDDDFLRRSSKQAWEATRQLDAYERGQPLLPLNAPFIKHRD